MRTSNEKRLKKLEDFHSKRFRTIAEAAAKFTKDPLKFGLDLSKHLSNCGYSLEQLCEFMRADETGINFFKNSN